MWSEYKIIIKFNDVSNIFRTCAYYSLKFNGRGEWEETQGWAD